MGLAQTGTMLLKKEAFFCSPLSLLLLQLRDIRHVCWSHILHVVCFQSFLSLAPFFYSFFFSGGPSLLWLGERYVCIKERLLFFSSFFRVGWMPTTIAISIQPRQRRKAGLSSASLITAVYEKTNERTRKERLTDSLAFVLVFIFVPQIFQGFQK